MSIDSLLSRARYLALALPLFALGSTVHAGCNTGPNGLYYTTYGNNGNRVPSSADSPQACDVFRTGFDGYGYFAPCDGEGYGSYGGSGGYAP